MPHARLLRSSVALFAVVSWVVVASGCPGTLTDEEKKMFQGGGSCPDIPSFLTAKCGNAGCHPQGATLDLASAGVEARLVGKAASVTCGGAIFVNPADPAGSLLYKKLNDSPPCGSKMPLGSSLTQLEIDCIKTWIGERTPTGGTGGSGGAGGAGGSGGTGG
jgi:hypothetical protein